MVKSNVFLDSSILITALLSTRGGSFYILNKFPDSFHFQINQYVLEEILNVLDRKFPKQKHLKSSLSLLLGLASVEILPNPSKASVNKLSKFINKDDAPILASALENGNFLLTLDKAFFDKNLLDYSLIKGLKILSPREFIEQMEL